MELGSVNQLRHGVRINIFFVHSDSHDSWDSGDDSIYRSSSSVPGKL